MSCRPWSFADTLAATEEYIDTLKVRGEYTDDAAKVLSGLRDWWANLQEIEHLAEVRRHEPLGSELIEDATPAVRTSDGLSVCADNL